MEIKEMDSMNMQSKTIVAICIIVGASVGWTGIFSGSVALSVLGLAILIGGIWYCHHKGLDVAEEKKRDQEFSRMLQQDPPVLPKITRFYGAIILASPFLIVASTLWHWLPISIQTHADKPSSLERIVDALQVPFGLSIYGSGYLLVGGKFSRDPKIHKKIFFLLLPFSRNIILAIGYLSLFLGLASASTFHRNNTLSFIIKSSLALVFGLFTSIYFNLPKVRNVFKGNVSQ